jgi:hypothetical protein
MKKKSPYGRGTKPDIVTGLCHTFDFTSKYPSVTPRLINKFVRISKLKKILEKI